MKFDPSQRIHLANKLMDSANIILASLVVGQFVERAIQWALVFVGLVFLFWLLS
jgi:hypothetical protein